MLPVKKSINDIEFSVFDVETTGLFSQTGDKICEIAAVKIKQGKTIDKFYSLVNPLRPIPIESYNIHHIPDSMVKDANESGKILPSFLEFIQGTCLCGYNVGFDIGFLENELGLIDLTLDSRLPIIDVLKIARKLFPDLTSHSLLNFSKSMGIATSQKHRAMDDVELTVKVLELLLNKLRKSNLTDFEDIHNLFGKNSGLINNTNQRKIDQIARAIDEKLKLNIKYFTSSNNKVTTRLIKPIEIVEAGTQKYLNAYCYLRKDSRNFKLEGILEILSVENVNISERV